MNEEKLKSIGEVDEVPTYDEFMLPYLRIAGRGEANMKELADELAKEFRLSQVALAERTPAGGQTKFANRVGWARTYLRKAGLIETPRRGYIQITDRGREVLGQAPERLDAKFLSRFEEFRAFNAYHRKPSLQESTEVSPNIASEVTPEEMMHTTHQEIETALADELLDRVRAAAPDFFERLIVDLLLAMGYGGSVAEAGRAIGRSGDDGVDGVIDQDELGLDRVYIQAKRYTVSNSVGPGAIRDFSGSLELHKASKGLFVTTSSFTTSAKETAERLSKRIVLIDGAQLAKLMIRRNVGCRIVESLHIRKIDEDFFEEVG